MRRWIGEKHFAPFPDEPYGRGWYAAMGSYKFGPLPRREASAEPTWPPKRLESESAPRAPFDALKDRA